VEESANQRAIREMFVKFGHLSSDPALIDAWLAHYSEDVVWDAMEDAPDAGTYRGHAGIRGYAEDWIATVDEPHLELRELEEVAGCVVSQCHAAARIKGTDSELGFDYWQVARFEDGKIRRVKEFRERDEAIAFAEAGAPDP
jgi:ketosteroid isomerase-like protein